MSNRVDFYFRQAVTEAELDQAFSYMEDAIWDVVADQELYGVLLGGNVVEHTPTADLTVDIDGPFIAYSQSGERISFVSPSQNLDMSVDENGAGTAVPNPGDSRVLSIFAAFDRALSDEREDGAGNPVFYQRLESLSLNVVAGLPALTGSEVPPDLRGNEILLADVTIDNGQTQIFDADIDISRRQDLFSLDGDFSVVAGNIRDALQAIIDKINLMRGPKWRDDIDLSAFDQVAGPAVTFNQDRSLTIPAGAQVQYKVPLDQGDTVNSIKYRHADGVTPTGELRVQPGESTTAGAVSVVTVNPLQAATDLPQSTNFTTHEDPMVTPFQPTEDTSLLISISNIGVESCILHRILPVVLKE